MIKREIEKARAAREAAIQREALAQRPATPPGATPAQPPSGGNVAHKPGPTDRRLANQSSAERPFAAKLAAVREDAVMQTIFASGPRRKGSREIAATLATLFSAATRAA